MNDRRAGPNIETVLERLASVDEKFDARVVRIEGKVDDLKTQAEKDLNEIKVTMKVDTARIFQLELWQARWEGVRFAFKWLPPLLTGIAVGVGVIALGKVLG